MLDAFTIGNYTSDMQLKDTAETRYSTRGILSLKGGFWKEGLWETLIWIYQVAIKNGE